MVSGHNHGNHFVQNIRKQRFPGIQLRQNKIHYQGEIIEHGAKFKIHRFIEKNAGEGPIQEIDCILMLEALVLC